MPKQLVSELEILKAAKELEHAVLHTPLQYDAYLSKKYHCRVYLKREDLQRVRSFKLRGAYYAISKLSVQQAKNGIVCASAGNHAQGVAYTCAEKKILGTIFMPVTTPNQKVSQVQFFGGNYVNIRLVGDTFDASAESAKAYAKENNQIFIDPFDHPDIIAGQGSMAVEIFQDLKNEAIQADHIYVAVGGGGLISGIATYTKAVSPNTKVIGVEPKGAPSMSKSLAANQIVGLNKVDKFVDGACVKVVGEHTFAHAKAFVDEMITVDEGRVCQAILDAYTRQAIVCEPAGALSIAALEDSADKIKGKTIVCVVSGGNNDINRMTEIEERALLFAGLKHYFIINFPQRPGALKEFVSDILGPEDDITKFEYTKKVNRGNGPAVVGVLLSESKNYFPLIERIRHFDPDFIDLGHNKSLYTLLV